MIEKLYESPLNEESGKQEDPNDNSTSSLLCKTKPYETGKLDFWGLKEHLYIKYMCL